MSICVTLFLLYGCKVTNYANDKIEGTFIHSNTPCIKLAFKNRNFYYVNGCDGLNHIANYTCCDTIARGTYSINNKKGFIELSSDINIRHNILDVDVHEKVDESIKDSIIVEFNNPVINSYRYDKPLIFEVVLLGLYDTSFQKNDERSMSFKSLEGLNGIAINIYPKVSDLLLSNFGITKVALFNDIYPIRNPNANVLEIDIPDLTHQYLSSKRLNKDYVNIINKDKLLWDGHKYLKEISK
ncbi:hypothetical protein ABW636_09550 [Aquimarina sp. 2201CG1-2-11]|uniref:hypothetical protein n=1 Tax=Aquimarina discodermiae TaxID=3231043 RepID=UPI0034636B0A